MFVGGGVEHYLHGLLLQHAAHQLAIGDAAEHGHQLKSRGKAAAQLLIDAVEAGFAALEQHQAAGPERQDLTAELGADRATGATDQHHLAGDARAEQLRIGRYGVAAEELFDSNRAKGINAGAAAGDLLHRGHLQHGDAEGLKIVNDAAALAAAEGGDRQQHLIHIAAALAQDLGRLNGDAIDFAAPEPGLVVEEQFHAVAAGMAQGCSELHSGGACAVDGHADEGVAGLVLEAHQQITQCEAHRAGEAREQQPEQQPATAGRQRQPQHHAHEHQQHQQQPIAASKAIQGLATHVAGESLVLTGEGVERNADQQGSRQHPEALEKVGVKGMG